MKSIELSGYGSIQISGLKFKDQDGKMVDLDGKPVKYVVEGKGKAKYVRSDGSECPRNQVCKMMEIDGEEEVMPKFNPTTKIDEDVITVVDALEHDNCEARAIEKSWYVVSDSGRIKAEVDGGKVFEFPIVVGHGHKVWKGVLKNFKLPNGKSCHVLHTIRGNIDTAIEQFVDNPIEIEIPMIEQKQNIKKIFKSIGI